MTRGLTSPSTQIISPPTSGCLRFSRHGTCHKGTFVTELSIGSLSLVVATRNGLNGHQKPGSGSPVSLAIDASNRTRTHMSDCAASGRHCRLQYYATSALCVAVSPGGGFVAWHSTASNILQLRVTFSWRFGHSISVLSRVLQTRIAQSNRSALPSCYY
jgi:hypothetical protein